MTYIQQGETWATTRSKINQVIKVSYTDLLADTELTYTGGESGTVTAGDLYPTTEGNWFEVAASAAVDQHITTAGGVKMYEAGPQFSTRARAAAAWARMVARSEVPPAGTVWTWPDGAIRYDGSTTSTTDFSGWAVEGEPTFEHYGAVGDGVTDDTDAVNAAAAANAYVVTLEGKTYETTLASHNFIPCEIRGKGRVAFNLGDASAPYKRVTTQPSVAPGYGTIYNALQGEYEGNATFLFVGPNALGSQGSSGYYFQFETAAHFTSVRNEAGWSLVGYDPPVDGTNDRSGYVVHATQLEAQGYGDQICYNIQATAYVGSDSGTQYTMREWPAVVGIGGNLQGQANYTAAAWGEWTFKDNGYLVRMVGPNINFERDNNDSTTGANYCEAFKIGSNGTYPMDVAITLVGLFTNGLDTTRVTTSGFMPLVMSADQELEFHGEAPTNALLGFKRFGETKNGWRIGYNSTNGLYMKAAGTIGFKLLSDHVAVGNGSSNTRALRITGDANGRLELGQASAISYVRAGSSASENTQLIFGVKSGASTVNTLQLKTNGSVDVLVGPLQIAGTDVLSGQMSTVSDPSGGATVDTECRAQLAALIDQLQAVSLMA